jgi:hypothetical protein
MERSQNLRVVLIKRHSLHPLLVAVASGWVRGTSRELGALEAELSENILCLLTDVTNHPKW